VLIKILEGRLEPFRKSVHQLLDTTSTAAVDGMEMDDDGHGH
jgi:hypothetical protein